MIFHIFQTFMTTEPNDLSYEFFAYHTHLALFYIFNTPLEQTLASKVTTKDLIDHSCPFRVTI